MVQRIRVAEGEDGASANDDTTVAGDDKAARRRRRADTSAIGRRPFKECVRPPAADKSRRPANPPPPPSAQRPACNLPMLDYYLTFIHYFGFSINPNDDTNSRHLSIRVKRAAAFAASMRLHRLNLKLRKQTSGGGVPGAEDADAETQSDTDEDEESLAERRNQTESAAPCGQTQERHKWRKRLRLTVKFLAIALTSFLALNHLLVLIDYARQGSKVLTELLLEMRLVITKLSALIFVASWHRNQARVRHLIRLVKSTSVNILAHEQAHLSPAQSLKWLNRRVLAWWLVCTSVTLVHFSLSEAEIKSADHLWEWLDDYSLHTLSNATISETSLLALASFDNYVYTVHVYGTRLIGASIICIVSSFQAANIECLARQALSLLQASQMAHMRVHDADKNGNKPGAPAAGSSHGSSTSWSWWWPAIWGSLDSVLVGGGAEADPRLQNAGAVGGQLKLDWAQQRRLCKSFFVLGESDWLQVERERHQLAPLGWLSSTLSARSRQLAQVVAGVLGLARRCVTLAKFRVRRWRPKRSIFSPASRVAFTNRVTPFAGRRGKGPFASWAHRRRRRSGEPLPGEVLTKGEADQPNSAPPQAGGALPEFTGPSGRAYSHDRCATGASALRDYFNDYLARERARGILPSSPLDRADDDEITQSADEQKRGQPRAACHNQQAPMLSGQQVELQLDSLARKYELIRTVNLRIDACFGHILLSQYLFLFLMSCIDVVFFSLSFSTNTKTKYIIVSGMILLWLPYLLLYRYASDIGLASEQLLTSVRRLARLALVLQLSAAGDNSQVVAGGCGRAGARVVAPAVAAAAGHSPPGSEQVATISGGDKLTNWSAWSGELYHEDNFALLAPARRPAGLNFWPASTLWHYRHLFCRQADVAMRADSDKCLPSALILNCATAGQERAVQAPQEELTRRLVPEQEANPPTPQKARDGTGTVAATTNGQSSQRARIFNKLDHVFKPSHLSIVGIMTLNKFFLLDFAKIVITASVMTIQFITKR